MNAWDRQLELDRAIQSELDKLVHAVGVIVLNNQYRGLSPELVELARIASDVSSEFAAGLQELERINTEHRGLMLWAAQDMEGECL